MGLRKHYNEQSYGDDGILAELFKLIKCNAFKVLHSIKCYSVSANLKNSAVATGLEKGSDKECSNYHTIALISQASKVMLKILQGRLQQYMNQELPDEPVRFIKGRGMRDQIANICWITEKAREFQNICFIDYVKAFDYVYHKIMWKILKEMGIPDHLTCLLRNLCAGQEATVRTGHGTMDWFKSEKGVH